MPKSKKPSVGRRGFLKTAAAGAAAFVARPEIQTAQQTANVVEAQIIDRPGSDFMLDVFKSMGFDYLFANPGGSFGGLHESVINYGNNKSPEFITCMHEESSVAMAHGYAKVEGKPVLAMAHGTVGLQHAAMALYNAAAAKSPGFTVCKMPGPWFAISRSGTIRRFRCSISPNPPCVLTRLQ